MAVSISIYTIIGNILNAKITPWCSNDAKNYLPFGKMFGLEQIINSPTSITCRNTPLLDHFLASIFWWISQLGVVNVGVSDHQLIYCTRKINKLIAGCVHKHLSFHSFKKYSVYAYTMPWRKSISQITNYLIV